MEVVITADTHVPTRATQLPDALWAAIDAADVVVHAGDWMAPALVDELADRAARLIAVWGNNDGDEVRARLPEVAHADVDGLALGVVHETGDARGRERRCDARFGPVAATPVDVLVFGHSHIPWDTVTPAGVRLLNPGSPTDRRRQPVATFLTATVRRGTLRDVELHPVP